MTALDLGFHRPDLDGAMSDLRQQGADDVVVLRTYGDELTAQIAAMSLQANGILAQVSADTAGGALPGFAILFPVRLIVRAADAALARTILDTEAPPPPDDGEPGSAIRP